MNREDLQKLIQDKIQEVTHEYLRELSQNKKVKETSNYLNSSDIHEDEFDNIFFHGGSAPKNNNEKYGKITIKEGVESGLKITVSEIKEFENSFEEILKNIPGASIVFDKQKNGYSLSAVKRPDGVEAKSSGIINLGDNGKITWSYSLLNGFNVNAQNLKLSQGNKTMFEALTNHYDDWQKEWREKLNLPSAQQTSDGGMKPGDSPEKSGQEMGMPPVTGAGTSAPTSAPETTGAAPTA